MCGHLKFLTICVCYFIVIPVYSQNNVGIGTSTPAPDAVLELKSNHQGVLVPRLSTTERLAIVNPSNGLLVYDTNYNCFYYYNAPAAIWNSMCAGPTSPTQHANVQVYYSNGLKTLITDTTMLPVNGLSITVTLTDTATIMLSSNGSILGADTISPFSLDTSVINLGWSSSVMSAGFIQTRVQLYENGVPIPGTDQSNRGAITYANIASPPLQYAYTHWSVSAVVPLLPPGTYLFELRAAKALLNNVWSDDFYVGYDYDHRNQAIITAEAIY